MTSAIAHDLCAHTGIGVPKCACIMVRLCGVSAIDTGHRRYGAPIASMPVAYRTSVVCCRLRRITRILGLSKAPGIKEATI